MHTEESRDPLLAAPLDALRGALAEYDTPPAVENELMAAFARQHPKRRWYQRISAARWGMAGGVGSAALLVLALSLHTQPQVAPGAAPFAGPFIALEPLERIRSDPGPRIVETRIARTALAGLGMPVTPENAGDQVRAEMLIGADGQPLALRLSSL